LSEPLSRRLDELQPSQLYISAAKLAAVQRDFDPRRPERLEPIPIQALAGRVIMTDGHTRALAAYRAGLAEVAVVWDEDELDWAAYQICVDWCLAAGIRTVADLHDRVVPADVYEVVWHQRCAEMQRGLERARQGPPPAAPAGEMRYCPACGAVLAAREIEGRERPACSCGYVHWGNPVPVVGAIVEVGEAVLLTRKASWPAGRWGLVAGFVEAGETVEEAAAREVREETGLAAQVVGLVGVYTLVERNQVYIVYRLRADGAWQVGAELEALREFTRAEVAALVEEYPPQSGAGRALRVWLGG